ncbi:hypothetical protein CONE_0257 [Candidatus Kinetoplastibacterium oncopeltii TCC290E]|uniref:Uncharacterized protein n=1 Tax=Candidatus Kinetoplastidibacterium stringomonadis TCC290E TaxID=1208920 RepID=M1LVF8_9PROT|nr:ATP synthase subunit I [Candidatus Kinetoplastibacterium oncopeltii]AGF48076.1 hypothetical protein CONE_0257 [Candidatus Kinetoplastibacterium oncopeltii TCC290E]
MSSMIRVIIYQWIMSVVFSVIGLLIGYKTGMSFFLGCSAFLIPNLFFASYLSLISNIINYREQAYFFLVGNFVKLVLSVFLLYFFVFIAPENISWFFYLLGLFFSLKGHLLLLFFQRFM